MDFCVGEWLRRQYPQSASHGGLGFSQITDQIAPDATFVGVHTVLSSGISCEPPSLYTSHARGSPLVQDLALVVRSLCPWSELARAANAALVRRTPIPRCHQLVSDRGEWVGATVCRPWMRRVCKTLRAYSMRPES